jgi:hypothetical protein
MKHNVSEAGSMLAFRWRGVQWLRSALSFGPNRDRYRSSFTSVVFSVIYNSGLWTKSINQWLLSVIHHRQNPLHSTPGLYLEGSPLESRRVNRLSWLKICVYILVPAVLCRIVPPIRQDFLGIISKWLFINFLGARRYVHGGIVSAVKLII